MQFYTYLHCKLNGDPFYVGKGKGYRSHRLDNRSEYHKRIVAKYGINIFVFPANSEKEAFADERHMIAQLRKDGYELCNMTNGGEGISGHSPSIETRAKMSASQRNVSEETRRRRSIALKGRKPSIACIKAGIAINTGKIASQETRERLRISSTGRIKSAEERAKLSSANKGKLPSIACRNAALLKNTGRKLSDKHKEILLAAITGRVKSPEEIAKIVAFHKGAKRPKEFGMKMSRLLTGKKLSQAHKENISAANVGKHLGMKHTDEARKKIREARAKQIFTPETKAKLSASAKAQWVRQKLIKLQQGEKYGAS